MSILIFVLLFILIIFIVGLSFVFSIVRGILSFLGLGRRKTGGSYRQEQRDNSYGGYRQQQSDRQQNTDVSGWHYSPEAENKRKRRKKIFDANEGEYVDFEEIKE